MFKEILKNLVYFFSVIGSCWQIFSISINFFQFDIVSVISITKPGTIEPKTINICFDIQTVINDTKFQNLKSKSPGQEEWNTDYEYIMMRNRLTSKEKNFITYDIDEIFPRGDVSTGPRMKFGFGKIICYQLSDGNLALMPNDIAEMGRLSVRSHKKDVVSMFGTFFDGKLIDSPAVAIVTEFGHFPEQVSIDSGMDDMWHVVLTTHSFKVTKLPSPYTDDCYDYTNNGHRDKNDAVDYCVEVLCNKLYNSSSSKTFFTIGNDFESSIVPTVNMTKHCNDRHFRDNCHHETHFDTVIGSDKSTADFKLFEIQASDVASYVIVSNPKMDNIDYVTYVFGALGTWFGFSFLMINPVDLVFKQSNNLVDPVTDQSDTSTIVTNLGHSSKFQRLNYKINQFMIGFNEDSKQARERIDQVRKELNHRRTMIDTLLGHEDLEEP